MGLVEVWDRVFTDVAETSRDDLRPWTTVLYEHWQMVDLLPEQMHHTFWNPPQRTDILAPAMLELISLIKEVGFVAQNALIDECGNLIDGNRRKAAVYEINIGRHPKLVIPCRVIHSSRINPERLFAILNSTQKKVGNNCQLRIWAQANQAVTNAIAERSAKFCEEMGGLENTTAFVKQGGDLMQKNAISALVKATGLSHFAVGMWLLRHFQWRKTKSLLFRYSPEEIKRFIQRGERPRM